MRDESKEGPPSGVQKLCSVALYGETDKLVNPIRLEIKSYGVFEFLRVEDENCEKTLKYILFRIKKHFNEE
ncbi:MAG: hypothetical protein ACLULK_08470 [Anaerovoracaceae bacterium]